MFEHTHTHTHTYIYIYIFFFNHVPTLFSHASLAGTKSDLFFVSNQSCSKNHPFPHFQKVGGRDCLGWLVLLFSPEKSPSLLVS